MTRKIFLGIIAALIIVISVMSIKKPVAQTAIPETAVQNQATDSTVQQTDLSQNNTTATKQEQVATPTTIPSAPASTGYTTQSVALHNSASSCYTIVNGNVYDMTNWISQHPGGRGAIKAMCGIDASAMFNNQHGGQGGPERILASYKLGALN